MATETIIHAINIISWEEAFGRMDAIEAGHAAHDNDIECCECCGVDLQHGSAQFCTACEFENCTPNYGAGGGCQYN